MKRKTAPPSPLPTFPLTDVMVEVDMAIIDGHLAFGTPQGWVQPSGPDILLWGAMIRHPHPEVHM